MISANDILKTLKIPFKKDLLQSEKFLLKNNFIFKLNPGAGIYVFSPLGLIYLEKIKSEIRNRMIVELSVPEVILPTMSKVDLWNCRANDEKFLSNGYCFSPTSEEVVKKIWEDGFLFDKFFQFSKNFRNELRPQFSLIRCKEFMMKDGYAKFNSHEEAVSFYQQVLICYQKFFDDIKLPVIQNNVFEDGETTEFFAYTNSEMKSMIRNNEHAIELAHVFLFESKVFDLHLVTFGIGITRLFQTFIEIKIKNEIVDFGILNPFAGYEIVDRELTNGEKLNNILYDDRKIDKGKKIFDAKSLGLI